MDPKQTPEYHAEPPDGWETERVDGPSPDLALVRAIIEAGIAASLENPGPSIKVSVDGRQKFLSQFLASDLYDFDLSASEREGLLATYLYMRVEKGEIVSGVNHQASLGHGAVRAADEYDFRERQAGTYKDYDD